MQSSFPCFKTFGFTLAFCSIPAQKPDFRETGASPQEGDKEGQEHEH